MDNSTLQLCFVIYNVGPASYLLIHLGSNVRIYALSLTEL